MRQCREVVWIGRRIDEFFGGGYSRCTDCTGQGNHFELIPTVKVKTRHPVEGYFGSEFPAICNHFGVTAALSRKTLDIFCENLTFFENDPVRGNFQNSVPKFREIWPTGNR